MSFCQCCFLLILPATLSFGTWSESTCQQHGWVIFNGTCYSVGDAMPVEENFQDECLKKNDSNFAVLQRPSNLKFVLGYLWQTSWSEEDNSPSNKCLSFAIRSTLSNLKPAKYIKLINETYIIDFKEPKRTGSPDEIKSVCPVCSLVLADEVKYFPVSFDNEDPCEGLGHFHPDTNKCYAVDDKILSYRDSVKMCDDMTSKSTLTLLPDGLKIHLARVNSLSEHIFISGVFLATSATAKVYFTDALWNPRNSKAFWKHSGLPVSKWLQSHLLSYYRCENVAIAMDISKNKKLTVSICLDNIDIPKSAVACQWTVDLSRKKYDPDLFRLGHVKPAKYFFEGVIYFEVSLKEVSSKNACSSIEENGDSDVEIIVAKLSSYKQFAYIAEAFSTIGYYWLHFDRDDFQDSLPTDELELRREFSCKDAKIIIARADNTLTTIFCPKMFSEFTQIHILCMARNKSDGHEPPRITSVSTAMSSNAKTTLNQKTESTIRSTIRNISVTSSQTELTSRSPTYTSKPTTLLSTNLTTVSTASTKLTSRVDVKTTKEFHYIKNCPMVEIDGRQWPATDGGTVAYWKCLEGTEYASWKCGEDGQFVEEGPDYTKCCKLFLKKALSKIDSGDILDYCDDVKELTRDVMNLTEIDMTVIAESISSVSKSIDMIPDEEIKEVVQNVVDIADNLLHPLAYEKWKKMSVVSRQSLATKLLQNTERVALYSAYRSGNSTILTSSSIDLQIISEREKHEGSLLGQITSQILKYEHHFAGSIFAEPKPFESHLNTAAPNTVAVGSTFKTIQQFLGFANVASSIKVSNSTFVNSRLLGLTFMPLFVQKTARVQLFHLKIPSSEFSVQCVFWNMSLRSGFWDNSGCDVDEANSNATQTVCLCNHLTNFAILMDINDEVPKSETYHTLTMALLMISIISLILTLSAHFSIRLLRNRKGWITCNLSACLCLAQILFMFSTTRPKNEILCAVLAALMEYFWLAAFMWMLWEGYYLYKMIIKIFNPKSLKFKWFSLVAYGVPVIPISVAAGIKPGAYRDISDDMCWIRSDDGFRWSFTGPICMIVMINCVIFLAALYSARKACSSKPKKRAFLRLFKGSVSLMSILGITWVFGLLIPVHSAFTTLFVLLNASQGVFIFFFNIVINQAVSQALSRRFDNSKFNKTIRSISSGSRTSLVNWLSNKSLNQTKTKSDSKDGVNCEKPEEIYKIKY